MEDGAFCGVFDGHGKNGHTVSKLVRNKLPSLLLNQKNALTKINKEREDGETMVPKKTFHKWKEACISAFKAMDKEIKLLESLDCSCSGTTAVVVIRQGEDLVIANLGDSSAVLGTMTEDGVVRPAQLTTDLEPSLPKRIRKSNGQVWDVLRSKEVAYNVSSADSEEAEARAVRQQPPPPPLHLMERKTVNHKGTGLPSQPLDVSRRGMVFRNLQPSIIEDTDMKQIYDANVSARSPPKADGEISC
ncbi:unnamed protein product [Camellia sinensis]